MKTEQIYKEWNRWMRARGFGFPDDLKWSDQKGYKEYDQNITRWMLMQGEQE